MSYNSPKRNHCCFCIPYRLAVAFFSILSLALGAATLWNVLRTGSKITDSTSKIAAYVATGVYGLLGVCGLFSVFFKRYALAKNFSVLWWTVTVLTTVLAIAGTILLATREKDEVKTLCQSQLLEDDHSGKYSSTTGGLALANDVDDCYKWTMIFAGVATAVQLFLMSVGGFVASQYTREVKFEKEGLSYIYGQGYLQPQAPVPSAHPYTHPYTKADY
ncbi:hypothetical protein EMPS_01849 [Entomortierella parvispora]|uniref:Uncharacterized protein n=1 Tax=Entomortierella parvispora TaxID=205924 RepID=A0A9P3LT03_9FUNG|nr:hypothetical protein EMPS_01849 [Entomortierella parvispora]